MINGQLVGTLISVEELVVNVDAKDSESSTFTVPVVSYLKVVKEALESFVGSKVVVTGNITNTIADGLSITALTVVKTLKGDSTDRYFVSGVFTPTSFEDILLQNNDCVVKMNSYSRNVGKDSGLSNLKLSHYNPTPNTVKLLEDITKAGTKNKKQLQAFGLMNLYLIETNDGVQGVIPTLNVNSFELLRDDQKAKETSGSSTNYPVANEEDEF